MRLPRTQLRRRLPANIRQCSSRYPCHLRPPIAGAVVYVGSIEGSSGIDLPSPTKVWKTMRLRCAFSHTGDKPREFEWSDVPVCTARSHRCCLQRWCRRSFCQRIDRRAVGFTFQPPLPKHNANPRQSALRSLLDNTNARLIL